MHPGDLHDRNDDGADHSVIEVRIIARLGEGDEGLRERERITEMRGRGGGGGMDKRLSPQQRLIQQRLAAETDASR